MLAKIDYCEGMDILSRKRQLEERIRSIEAALEAIGVGVKGSLVDSDGFPMKDVDLYEVRRLRGEYNRLQTDHAAVMAEIEQRLPELLAQNRKS